jgi:tRNA modification GTPase
MNTDADTIVAIATAPGRGGIGVVRVSGRSLQPIITGLLGEAAAARLQPRRALYGPFLDAEGAAIDAGLALLFPAPHSYTGESVLELQGHGGPVVLRLVLARCLAAGAGVGARIAEPGEFTRRAFLNDRLDLAQAEAVGDLIDAGTAAAARGAVRSLQGEFSRAAHALAGSLTELRALTEATLDFPEEEIDFLRAADAGARLDRAIAALAALRQRARQGALLRSGLQVALVGEPNVGKSSLLNALAGEDVAIVTEHAGTTRDRLERTIEIDGVAFTLIDTAGLRETHDPVEKIGIARAHAAAAAADIVVELVDDAAVSRTVAAQGAATGAASAQSDVSDAAGAPGGVANAAAAPGGRLDAGAAREGLRQDAAVPGGAGDAAARRLRVHNKIDITGAPAGARDGAVYLSAATGDGIAALRTQLLAASGWAGEAGGESVFLARERHLQALDRAAASLDNAHFHAAAGAARLELFAEDLRLAAAALGDITGTVSSDDLLGQIFGRFCIGK